MFHDLLKTNRIMSTCNRFVLETIGSRLIMSKIFLGQSKMTLNYPVIVETYPFSNGVVGGSMLAVKSSLYLTEKTS